MTSNLLLSLGVLATALTHYRFSSPRLAWVANVPFLLFALLRSDDGITSFDAFDASPRPTLSKALLLLLSLTVGHTLAVAKICTQHIPLAMSPMFGVPIGAVHFGGYLLWWHVASRLDISKEMDVAPPLPLRAWLSRSGFSTAGQGWGAGRPRRTSQVGNLALLQISSITGLSGPGFPHLLVQRYHRSCCARVDGRSRSSVFSIADLSSVGSAHARR